MAEKNFPITVLTSAGLFTQPSVSLESVPQSGFTRILNFRRSKDQLIRREGYIQFLPNASAPSPETQYTFDATESVECMAELVRPNGERAIVACGRTKIKKFDYDTLSWATIGSGFSNQGRRWQIQILNGYAIFNNAYDLPQTWRVEDATVTPMYELRQVGVASCECIAEYSGWFFIGNVREIIASELDGIMNGANPYGPVADSKVNHIPTLVAWSEFGEPRRWAPIFEIEMNSASDVITLPFPIGDTFVAGETNVAVVNGGPSGGTLGGQENTPNGVPIVSIVGTVMTLAESTDVGLTYPRTVQVMRWSDVSTLVGKSNIQGDSSAIVALKKLQNQLIIYRTQGIFTARYVGTVDTPFSFREKYSGFSVPIWRDCIGSLNGEEHLYPGVGGRWYSFDGITEPVVHSKTDNASDLFFDGLSYTEQCYCVDNPLTGELWFVRSGRVFAFDQEHKFVTEIDYSPGGACIANRPAGTDKWWVMAFGKNVYTYALVEGATQIVTWFRDNVQPDARVVSGLFYANDQNNEKTLLEFTPLFSSPSPNCAVEVQLRSAWNANADLEDLLDPAESLPSPEGRNYIPTLFQATYFQYELSVTDARDVDCRLSGVNYTLDGIRAKGVTRSVDL